MNKANTGQRYYWDQIEKWNHSLKKLKPPDVNPGCPTIFVYKKEENEKVEEKHGSSFLYSFFLVLTQHCWVQTMGQMSKEALVIMTAVSSLRRKAPKKRHIGPPPMSPRHTTIENWWGWRRPDNSDNDLVNELVVVKTWKSEKTIIVKCTEKGPSTDIYVCIHFFKQKLHHK